MPVQAGRRPSCLPMPVFSDGMKATGAAPISLANRAWCPTRTRLPLPASMFKSSMIKQHKPNKEKRGSFSSMLSSDKSECNLSNLQPRSLKQSDFIKVESSSSTLLSKENSRSSESINYKIMGVTKAIKRKTSLCDNISKFVHHSNCMTNDRLHCRSTSRTLAQAHPQPDLVTVSSPHSGNSLQIIRLQKDVCTLENTLDRKTLRIGELELEALKASRGFEAMLVVVQYISDELNSFCGSKFKRKTANYLSKVDILSEALANAKLRFLDMEDKLAAQSEEFRLKNKAFEARLHQELSQAREIYLKEFENIQIKNKLDWEIAQSVEWDNRQINLESEWQHRLDELQLQHLAKTEQMELLNNSLRQQVLDLSKNDELHTMMDLIERPQSQVTSKLLYEVDSLKSVVEMRWEEIKSLRLINAQLEEKLEKFWQISAALKSATARTEDLEEQLKSKCHVEKLLKEENVELTALLTKASLDKKRICMKNEELMWRMSQCNLNSLDSVIPSEKVNNHERQLSCSFAKERRWVPSNFYSVSEPNTPLRVADVVQKIESISWNIECNSSDVSTRPIERRNRRCLRRTRSLNSHTQLHSRRIYDNNETSETSEVNSHNNTSSLTCDDFNSSKSPKFDVVSEILDEDD